MKGLVILLALLEIYRIHGNGSGERAILKQLLENYYTGSRPVLNPSDVVKVKLTFHPMHIASVNERNQYITLKAYVTIRWVDEFLVWNQTDDGTEGLYIKPDQIWTPDIHIYNNIKDVMNLYDSVLKAIVYPNGSVVFAPEITFSVLCNISVNKYPFDTQVCHVSLSPWYSSKDKQTLTSDTDKLSLDLFQPNTEWHLSDTSVSCGLMYGDLYSICDFKMTLQRRSSYYVMNVLIPVFLLSIMTPFVYLLPQSSGERISYSITLFLAFSVTMTTISGMLPVTSLEVCYLEVLVQVQLFLSAVQSCCLVLSLRVGVLGEDGDTPAVLKKWAIYFKRRKYLKRVYHEHQSKSVENAEYERDSKQEYEQSSTINISGNDVSKYLDVALFSVFLGLILLSFIIFLMCVFL